MRSTHPDRNCFVMQRTSRLCLRALTTVIVVLACTAPARADEHPPAPVDPWAGLTYAVRARAAAEQTWYVAVHDAHAERVVERAPRPTREHAVNGDVFDALAGCESGGDPTTNTGNGFGGAFQFTASTWRSMGTGYSVPWDAPYSVQKDAARRLQARSGWGQWPGCARKLGLR